MGKLDFEDNYTPPTMAERQMFHSCRLCGTMMPHDHSICDGCDAEREQARIDAGEMVDCDCCGEQTLHNPCQECRDIEEATRL